jgi:ubiquitin carboxyl-terminal hydrolase L3
MPILFFCLRHLTNADKWANKAGLVLSSAQFNDVYGLDPEVRLHKRSLVPCLFKLVLKQSIQILAMVPRPVQAVVLVFPYREALAKRKAEDEHIAKEGGPNVAETVFWMKQTVRF